MAAAGWLPRKLSHHILPLWLNQKGPKQEPEESNCLCRICKDGQSRNVVVPGPLSNPLAPCSYMVYTWALNYTSYLWGLCYYIIPVGPVYTTKLHGAELFGKPLGPLGARLPESASDASLAWSGPADLGKKGADPCQGHRSPHVGAAYRILLYLQSQESIWEFLKIWGGPRQTPNGTALIVRTPTKGTPQLVERTVWTIYGPHTI